MTLFLSITLGSITIISLIYNMILIYKNDKLELSNQLLDKTIELQNAIIEAFLK